jgi:hypothetical protein
MLLNILRIDFRHDQWRILLHPESTGIVNDGTTVTPVVMTRTGVNNWTGIFPVANDGNYTVNITGKDLAQNTSTKTATFSKITIPTLDSNNPATIENDTTKLELEAEAGTTLNNADMSVIQHIENPSGLVENPEGAEASAAAFVEINAPVELRDALEAGEISIVVTVKYDPAELPAGTNESTLKLYSWSTDLGIWEEVEDSVVDTVSKTITGTLHHLSTYGVFGSQTPSTPDIPSGGFGGAAPIGKLTPKGFSVTTPLDISGLGIIQSDASLKTTDGQVTLKITSGTKLVNKYGVPLSVLTAETVTDPPAAPEGHALMAAYSFGPEGSTFDPALNISINYDPTKLPEGVAEKDLYIAYFDGQGWLALKSTVNPSSKTVSANINHFSNYALMGEIDTSEPIPTPTEPTPTPTQPAFTSTPSPTPTATQAPVQTPVKTQEPAPTTPATPTPPNHWPLIIGIIAAVVVIAVVVAFIMIRRRERAEGNP